MGHQLKATATPITGDQQIKCRFYLGAQQTTGTMLVDDNAAAAADATKRLDTLTAGERSEPSFPIEATEGYIYVSGSTAGVVFTSQ